MIRYSLVLFSILCIATTCLGESKLTVGKPAPDFELKGSDGKTYKLSDFKDKKAVVIAWYPKAFTGG
ncbi:MAG: redoxin domain-containing protein [Planctomycetales bacterium]|nr:redoxin domain-containing protein [Planctomycetales bacterium]